ncbi:MAG: hypothetical protein ACR2PJ_03610 [Pseudomonadales bacterium]
MTTTKTLKSLKAIGVSLGASLLLAMFAGSLSGCATNECPEGETWDHVWGCMSLEDARNRALWRRECYEAGVPTC